MSETIFVNLASYRDALCSTTISEIFTKADRPERVTVALCQQNLPTDADCVADTFPWKDNIKVIKVHALDAKGVMYARYLASTLYNNEDYYCQLDSHLKIRVGWDSLCISMLKQLKASGVSKPLLSYYPKSYEDHPDNLDEGLSPRNFDYTGVDESVTQICKAFYMESKGVLSFDGAGTVTYAENQLPRKVPFIAGGFVFADGKFIIDVPFDPDLTFTFVGEEILMSARAYTFGYDTHSPTKNIVFHKYTREGEPKIWTDVDTSKDTGIDTIRISSRTDRFEPQWSFQGKV